MSAAILLVMAIYGAVRLAAPEPPAVQGVRLRLVQPSVPQREKWRPENQGAIFRDHLELSQRGPEGHSGGLDGITHIVWPEAAMPFLPLETPEALAAIAAMLPSGTHLLSGALRIAADAGEGQAARRVYNSLLLFDAEGRLSGTYDKNHLVPFGEYLPLRVVWRAFGLRGLVEMRGAFEPGPVPRPLLDVPGLPPVGALICYEAIFPGDVVQGKERPAMLLSVTNDGWFGNMTGPRQHAHQARVRAVEEGLPLVRVANNGISAVFDADGRIVGRLGLNVRGVLDTPLPGARPPTVYARFGDGTAWIVAVLALLASAGLLHRRSP
jgi:apolipoprotein N-acyltransferase